MVAGCGSSADDSSHETTHAASGQSRKEVGDAFVAALLQGHAGEAETYVAQTSSFLLADLPSVSHDLRKYAYRNVGKPAEGGDGLTYTLVGRTHAKEPPTMVLEVRSRWKVFLKREMGVWKVTGYEGKQLRVGPLKKQ